MMGMMERQRNLLWTNSFLTTVAVKVFHLYHKVVAVLHCVPERCFIFVFKFMFKYTNGR